MFRKAAFGLFNGCFTLILSTNLRDFYLFTLCFIFRWKYGRRCIEKVLSQKNRILLSDFLDQIKIFIYCALSMIFCWIANGSVDRNAFRARSAWFDQYVLAWFLERLLRCPRNGFLEMSMRFTRRHFDFNE